MKSVEKKYSSLFLSLVLALICLALLNISLGSVAIPFPETLKTLFGQELANDSWSYIIKNYRIPKAYTAIFVGGGLSVSGLLMQTLFRNPLAGPFVLGINSGASLGAALLLLGAPALGGFFFSDFSLVVASSLGGLLVLAVVLWVARYIQNTMALLIVGLMFGSITAAIVSILAYFSPAEQLQRFVFWGFGSLGNLNWNQNSILTIVVFISIGLSIFSTKSLNAFLLGENYAQSLGVQVKQHKIIIILAAGLLAGGITAFAGPIAFVGLAVPHLTRQLFNTMKHNLLIPSTFLCGALLMLLCDTIAQLPRSASVLPINAITSIIGGAFVIWLLIKKKNLLF